MERLIAQVATAERALATLREALAMPFSIVVRDASIQRFEFTYEATWKALKTCLADIEGVAAGSPNQCFREACRVGILHPDGAEALLQISRDRNLTSHTYVEALAEAIFGRLPEHAEALAGLLTAVRARVPS